MSFTGESAPWTGAPGMKSRTTKITSIRSMVIEIRIMNTVAQNELKKKILP